MVDTAQPVPAAETNPNVAIDDAAAAFLAFDQGEPIPERKRDGQGRFAPESDETPEPEGDAEDAEGELPEAETDEPEGELEDDDTAAEDEAEAQPMPPSWPADQAENWAALPPETQAYLVEREGQREQAIQAKFQESANARKDYESKLAEAQTSQKEYANLLDTLIGAFTPSAPDPADYGLGTGQFNQEGYELAKWQYEQQAGVLENLKAQQATVREELQQKEAQQFAAWKQEHEAQYAPKLLTDVPELSDPEKGTPAINEIVRFAIDNGIPEAAFFGDGTPEGIKAAQDAITSAQLHLTWKAMQYDKLRAAKPQPKPKQVSPVAKPGVSSPRSAQKTAKNKQAMDKLVQSGSLNDAAAVFKQFGF